MILAIDPGNKESAWVLYDHEADRVKLHGKHSNEAVMFEVAIRACKDITLVIEKIACYGMPVGDEVFETVYWSGRFAQIWIERGGLDPFRIPRADVKMHLCKSMRAKDGNVMTALMDRWGGKSCKGTKKNPGPLYGVSGDVWAALGVAVTFAETRAKEAV